VAVVSWVAKVREIVGRHETVHRLQSCVNDVMSVLLTRKDAVFTLV